MKEMCELLSKFCRLAIDDVNISPGKFVNLRVIVEIITNELNSNRNTYDSKYITFYNDCLLSQQNEKEKETK